MPLALFAGIPVRSFEEATPWYVRLLGSEPSFFPHDTEAVWELAEHRSIYVNEDADRAGHATVLLFVDDLDDVVDGISRRGLEPTQQETYDNGVRKVSFRDPDGNEISFGGAPA